MWRNHCITWFKEQLLKCFTIKYFCTKSFLLNELNYEYMKNPAESDQCFTLSSICFPLWPTKCIQEALRQDTRAIAVFRYCSPVAGIQSHAASVAGNSIEPLWLVTTEWPWLGQSDLFHFEGHSAFPVVWTGFLMIILQFLILKGRL